ncbi:integrase [Ochrobactrum sp. MYb29]|nr:integrase [Ochrobactrum sp. MYb29]
MAGKVRHLKERNGRYSARLVVPENLRAIVGKTELETQLGADRRQALAKLPSAVAALQGKIALAEQQAKPKASPVPLRYPLTPEQIAHRHYQSLVIFDEQIRQSDPRFSNIGFDDVFVENLRAGIAGRLNDDQLESLVGDRIERFRLLGNTSVQKGLPEWRKLAMALCVSEYEALARSAERDEGIFNGAPEHPMLVKAIETPEQAPAVDIMELLEEYLKALERDGKGREARKRWTPVFHDLVKYVGHNDAASMTDDDIMKWRNKKVETLSTKTVSDVYMASVRAVLKWAVSEKKLSHNPATDVKVKKKKPVRIREKGFRDDEALAILKFCRSYQPKEAKNPSNREAPKTTAAKRWASILCAFTGARIVEMMQLRKEDVRKEGEAYVIRISPDAGSVKTGQYRDVPLHKQLIDEGFLKFVEASKPGPLFHNNAPEDALTGARTVAGRVSDWLRENQIVPDGVQPNHAWRHRFKTIANDLGLPERVVDAIQGHAGRTAGDGYGDVTIAAKNRVISQYPEYELDNKN